MGLANTAKLLASLDLDASKFKRGIGEATGSLGKLETRMGRIGGIAAQGARNAAANLATIGVVAAGVVASQVYAGIRSLEELERVTNATEGVIKSTGGVAGVTATQIRDMAQALESVTTADDKVIQGGQNLLLTFTNIGKDVFPQASKAMVDLGIAMAQGDVENADFKSSAIQLGKALNDPIKGITALTRVGVSFTEEQKKQIKTMVEAGDVAGAQTIILKELEREFGGAGKSAGKGFGADIRRVKDAVEDAQQALATGFLPLIRKVADVLSREIAKPSTIAAIKSFGENLATGLDRLIVAAGNIPWSSIGDAMQIAGTGAKVLFDVFVGLPPWVQTAVLTGWGLNKLTGGALGGIVGELGKGLIKGVLGITAGTVVVKAGVVTGVGGAPGVVPTGGGGSKLGSALGLLSKVFIVGFAAEAARQIAPAVTQTGIDIHDQLGLPTIKPDDVQWPFGPKNTPSILPEIFGGNGLLGGTAEVTPAKPQFGGMSPEVRDAARAQSAAAVAMTRTAAGIDRQTSELARMKQIPGANVTVNVNVSGTGVTKAQTEVKRAGATLRLHAQ